MNKQEIAKAQEELRETKKKMAVEGKSLLTELLMNLGGHQDFQDMISIVRKFILEKMLQGANVEAALLGICDEWFDQLVSKEGI